MSEYQAAHRRACASAITALGNRIGLYAGSTRVGTVFSDTTWGTATDVTEGGVAKAQVTGSTVTITIPESTVSNGTTIDRYGIHNGSTLLRTEELPVSLVINDGSQEAQVQVTPTFKYRGE
ncbi:hypothetical protein PBI_BIGNUZ_24 [Mycobacterium phage BigNuz]|uniref:Uncharacterized protein n=2 Tax=Bignuzvirus bignuz TaxID=1983736 RepID=G1JX39_9CAUD|nr:hypothetical protein PBI_BIGNUZ_24 [Mycobacterium phage BigNuz]AEL98187.1 hypothetical protein PBI_BIGNUZ_24 [Mycobacterium phage BigNuz]AOT24863.1 hypothetical protein PBI_NAZO_24 [Mycobacterium phage Nazo]